MAMLTGCLNIFVSKLRSVASLMIKITRRPTRKGSVGKYMSNSSPGTNSLSGILSGIRNIINRKILSKE